MQKSKARIKFDRDKPTLGGYWHWVVEIVNNQNNVLWQPKLPQEIFV